MINKDKYFNKVADLLLGKVIFSRQSYGDKKINIFFPYGGAYIVVTYHDFYQAINGERYLFKIDQLFADVLHTKYAIANEDRDIILLVIYYKLSEIIEKKYSASFENRLGGDFLI